MTPSPLSRVRLVFVGGGNMAAALIGGLLGRGARADRLAAIDPSEAQRAALAGRFGIATHAGASADALAGDVIVLAVKPQQMREAVAALAPHLHGQLLLSVAAGVRAEDLSRWLGGHRRIVRTMPNTPALLGLGATGLAALPGLSPADRALAETIVGAVGIAVWVDDESKLDAVTALSGSGPAYVLRFIESMIEGGVALGLSDEQARRLALQTALGAATLASSADEPLSVLRERVTSRGGTTAAGLAVLDERALPSVVAEAMAAACRRAEALGREFGAGD
jgi:pyrroline-5-carboxylate reductase